MMKCFFEYIECFCLVTAQDLWKTITSVSNAGAKRGRAKRRGATKFKDLNLGQRIGQGKMKSNLEGIIFVLIVHRQIKYAVAWSQRSSNARS